MDYKEKNSPFSSYTPRRKDAKYEVYGGLHLKTRVVQEGGQPHDRQRRASLYQQSTEYSQLQYCGLSKKRESVLPSYNNSKYTYGRRHEELPQPLRFDRDENTLKEIRSRQNRQIKPRDIRESKELLQQPQINTDHEYKKGSYLSYKRNEMIMKENHSTWNREDPATKKQNQPQLKKSMNPQLVEKLYSISKLNNRIRERLKNMTNAMDKNRA